VGAPPARVSGQRALPDESVQPGRAPGITSRHSIWSAPDRARAPNLVHL